jgi:hypothetical protein
MEIPPGFNTAQTSLEMEVTKGERNGSDKGERGREEITYEHSQRM